MDLVAPVINLLHRISSLIAFDNSGRKLLQISRIQSSAEHHQQRPIIPLAKEQLRESGENRLAPSHDDALAYFQIYGHSLALISGPSVVIAKTPQRHEVLVTMGHRVLMSSNYDITL